MARITGGDSFRLVSGPLQAELLTPWSRLYGRTRFNHSAFISEVIWKGYTFTRREPDQPLAKSTGGIGLCSQYKCPELEASVPVGGKWLKPGVGVMERLPEDWIHLDERVSYGLPTDVTAWDDAASFVCRSPEADGAAYHETRTVRLFRDRIRLDIGLKNTGGKPLKLLDYCHNFVSLGGEPVSPAYHLRLPCLITAEGFQAGGMIAEAGGVTWAETPREAFFKTSDGVKSADPSWELRSDSIPCFMGERNDFKPHHLAVWGLDSCVSAEVYHEISLLPGESAEWMREWYFGD